MIRAAQSSGDPDDLRDRADSEQQERQVVVRDRRRSVRVKKKKPLHARRRNRDKGNMKKGDAY
jgi:hypothetical protein